MYKRQIQEIVRAKPPGWTPDISIGESSTKRDPIVHDNSKPNGGKICASDGSVIGFGQSYYEIQRRNRDSWANTQAEFTGIVSNTIDQSASELLDRYRGDLVQTNPGGSIAPSYCPGANNSCFDVQHGGGTSYNEEYNPANARTSVVALSLIHI